MTNLTSREITALAQLFSPKGVDGTPKPFGGGHINDTYFYRWTDGSEYILQRISSAAFHHPEWVMENMFRVTEHLRAHIEADGGDAQRGTIRLLRTSGGELCAIDRNGDVWRSFRFISNSISYERSDDPEIMREAGRAFGRFQRMLEDFDAASLHETIPRFHDMPDRYRALHRAVEENPAGRLRDVGATLEELMAAEPFASALTGALERGELALRVTHNDTKLNNVLFDARTRRAICVIDLDTVMPGLAAYDFGDAIRSGASTAAEDEPNLELVRLSMPMFCAYAEGYLGEVGETLSERELLSLPVGARMMALETAVRFLTDYLQGDTYYRIAYPGHNLVRARTQLRLYQDMTSRHGEMEARVMEIRGRKG